MRPIFRKILYTFFFLRSLFSFSQNKYPEFFIEHDSVINPQFRDISDKIVSSLLRKDGGITLLKPYTDNLRPATGADILLHFSDTVEAEYDGVPVKELKMLGAEDVNSYVLRNDAGKNFICPVTKSETRLWLSLDELGGVLNENEVVFLEDLFVKGKTQVLCSVLRRADLNANFDNSMMSIFYKIRNRIIDGSITAFHDPYFEEEVAPDLARSLFTKFDTVEVESVETPGIMDQVVVSHEVMPTHFYYLFPAIWNAGKLTLDDSDPLALAPVVQCQNLYGELVENCYKIIYWIPYSDKPETFLAVPERAENYGKYVLRNYLQQYEQNIVMSNYKGRYNYFIVDRLSTSYCRYRNAGDSLFIHSLVNELKQKVQGGLLNAFSTQDFMSELTISETRNRLYNGYEIETDSGMKDVYKDVDFDVLGLVKYHYRANDRQFMNCSMEIGLAIARYDADKGLVLPALYLYLPQLEGVLRSGERDSLMDFFTRNILTGSAKLTVKSGDEPHVPFFLENEKGEKVYAQNLPQWGFANAEQIRFNFEQLCNNLPAETGISIYINSIGESHASDTAVQLIPYLGNGGTFPSNEGGTGGSVLSPFQFSLVVYHAGYCDAQGVVRVPLRYSGAELFSEGRGLVYNVTYDVHARAYKHCGFVDIGGKEMVPLEYDDARSFSDGLAAVKKNGKWGYLNKDGSMHYDFVFDNAFAFSEGRAVVKLDKKFGIIGTASKKPLCDMIYDSICDFHEGWARVLRDGKWGYINKKGKEKIPAVYISAEDFNGGIAKCMGEDGRAHYFNLKGAPLFEQVGDVRTAWGKTAVKKESGKYILIDLKGKKIADLDCDSVGEFSEGMLAVRKGLTNWAFVEMSGKQVIPYFEGSASTAPCFHDSVCTYFDNAGRMFVRDKSGRIVYEGLMYHDNRDAVFTKGFMLVHRGGLEYYIDRRGREYIFH